jgi:hypothetical protein
MKIKHLLFAGLAVSLASCSTAYRSGQTPDDVYYSPAPPENTYVVNKSEDRNSYRYQDEEEQDIRRGIRNPAYRSDISIGVGLGYSPYMYNGLGFGSYYNPYNPYAFNSYGAYGYKGIYDPYGYNMYGYSPYSSFSPYGGYSPYLFYGNNYFNPYYGSGYYSPIYAYPGIGSINYNSNTGPRRVNLSSYNNTGNSRISRTIPSSSVPVRTFSTEQPRQGTGVGNVIRRVFTPEGRSYSSPSNNQSYRNENSRSNNNNAPVRSFESTPSSNTGSSNSSGGGGSAPVRTFRR